MLAFQNVSPGEQSRIAILEDAFQKQGLDDRLAAACAIAALCRQRREGHSTTPFIDDEEREEFKETAEQMAQKVKRFPQLISAWKSGASVRTLVQILCQGASGDPGWAENCGQATSYFLPSAPPPPRRRPSGFEHLARPPAQTQDEIGPLIGFGMVVAFGAAAFWWGSASKES